MNEINKTQNIFQSLGLTAKEKLNTGDRTRLDQNDFLKLLTTQLQNQDPTKPLQNGEFMAQMAQFSTVTGIQDLQASFGDLASALYSNQALQASVMVGRTVQVPSNQGLLNAGGNLAGAADLPSSTSNLTVEITDAAGQLIKYIDMGQQPAGQVNFVWDGITDKGVQAPAGIYNVRAVANFGGDIQALGTLVSARVDSVSVGKSGEGLTLNLAGLGSFGFDEIRRISE